MADVLQAADQIVAKADPWIWAYVAFMVGLIIGQWMSNRRADEARSAIEKILERL